MGGDSGNRTRVLLHKNNMLQSYVARMLPVGEQLVGQRSALTYVNRRINGFSNGRQKYSNVGLLKNPAEDTPELCRSDIAMPA